MALSTEEKQILEYAKNNGKSVLEAKTAIAKFRSQKGTPIEQPTQPEKKPLSNRITDFLGLGGATETFGKLLARQGIGTDTSKEVTQEFVEKPTVGQVGGALLQTAAIPAGFALTGGASLAGQSAIGAGLGYAYDVGQDLIEKKSSGEVLTPGMGTVVGGVAPVAIRGLAAGVGVLKKPAEKIASVTGEAVTNTIPDSAIVQGTKQKATEIAERIPRFVGRVTEATQEQAIKAEKIRTATPQVAKALKVELPEKYINTVTQADPATKAAYKRVLDIADETPKTVGVKTNPTIVGGELAGKQYEVIEKQRETVGNAIGEEMKRLGLDKTKIDMRGAYDQLDGILEDQGIIRVVDEKGSRLDFSRSKLTPKQRQVVKDLHQMATEAGNNLSPSEIHRKDQLFSALQRESKAEQIEDILLDLPDGNKISMFRAFRDVYANQLDTLSPEIKDLNKKYRNIMTLIEDVEDSIFKTPNFNVTKTTDPAEFAKVNLRRIFGEAQSSPVYEAIADEMDTIARQLGYSDAKPKDIAAFAQEIRELYPESVPRAGFSGGIMSGLGDILKTVSEAGKADVVDQRKALRAILEATEQASK